MELLQKITLYDLLGYTVPGTIFITVLGICMYDGSIDPNQYKDYLGYICACTILLGYVIGIAISELTDFICKLFQKIISERCKKIKEKFDYQTISMALLNAGANIDTKSITSSTDILEKYNDFMYAAIQVDSKYSRIHNYASAQLICRNMAFVSLISTYLFSFYKGSYIGAKEFFIGIFIGFLFLIRYRKMKKKKETYTLAWFIQKYSLHADEQNI